MMKKISMIFFCLLAMICMTGCGTAEDKEEKEQTLVCTTTENEDGLNIEQVVSMTYQNDQLKHMKMEVNTKIIDSTAKENWEAFKNFMNEDNQEFDKDGIRLTVVTDDQNYEYNVILDIDVENATEEALEEQGFEGLKDDTSTLEESKESAEKDGAICEIK